MSLSFNIPQGGLLLAIYLLVAASDAALLSAADTDEDGDGLTAAQELAAGTDAHNRDTDGDGLWDSWEVNKKVLTTILADANPLVPDLYLEVGYFKDTVTDDTRKTWTKKLTDAFKARNIVLHVEWDAPLPNADRKTTYKDWVAIRPTIFDMKVKSLTHRHALLVWTYYDSGGKELGGQSDGIPGQWFIESTHLSSGAPYSLNGLVAIGMHEFGHTLGLSHGGLYRDATGKLKRDFKTMHKPQHLSVMNYNWSTTGLKRSTTSGIETVFDYQNFDLTALNESALNESVGIDIPSPLEPSVRGLLTRSRIKGESKDEQGTNVPAFGAIDWNRKPPPNEIRVQEDINGDFSYTRLEGTLNEWSNLSFAWGNIGSAAQYEIAKKP
jgi:hypothetical protein